MSDPTKLMEAILSGQEVQTQAAAAEQASEQPADDVGDGEQSTNPEFEVDHTGVLDDWAKSGSEEPEEEDKSKKEPDATEEETVSEKTSDESDVEYIKADGKKIKVDYSDKAKVKQAYKLAAGMRKFQKERDDAIQREKALAEETQKLKELWSKVEAAAESKDYNTLTKIMTKGEVDFDTLMQKRIEKMQLREDATEEELEKMDLLDKISSLEAQVSKFSSEVEEKSKTAAQLKEEAETKNLQTKVDSAFDRYRFHGKLDDPDAEQQLDSMLWTNVISKLEDYDNIDSEVIAKEFRRASAVLNKVVKKQADKQIKKTSKARKRNAKETAQVEQVRGYVDNNIKREAASNIRAGDLTAVLSDWGKYGKLFE